MESFGQFAKAQIIYTDVIPDNVISCTGGTWTKQLRWKAKASDSVGTNWSEKIVYDYWPDGARKQEQQFTAGDTKPRATSFHAADFQGTNALLYPRLGDWAVQKLAPTKKEALATEVRAAGLFDERWKVSAK